ncbi:MAG TPA: 50S ribosomal protein L4 [Candidatus Moranbacteria bacterium]|nr:50S ribosomal protein L4 [Candidatus Moranbacteria bacterium]
MKLSVYNKEGKEIKKIAVADDVFGLKKNDDLVHQVFVSIMSNRRIVLAHTKTRGERAGSGIKPWKQKGTGRARVGSVRTPIWKKGSVVFGPRKNRNYKKKINKKMKAKAVATVLSGKLKDGELKVLEKLELTNKKTREMARLINNLKIKGKTLIAFEEKERDLRAYSRNVKELDNILVEQLNVADMLNHKYLLMTKDSVKFLEKKYKKNKK